MILGLERLKEEVSAPHSLDTHSNSWELSYSHLLSQVYVLHEARKWKRHVKCRNGVPADLTILSILTSGSCTGLLANGLHANDQLDMTEYSPGLDFKALCEQLKIFSSILKAGQGGILDHSAFTQRHDPQPTKDKRGKEEAWNPSHMPRMQNQKETSSWPEYLRSFQPITLNFLSTSSSL